MDANDVRPDTLDAEGGEALSQKGFARRLGEALVLEPHTPGSIVSIESPWGFGKTTVLKLVESYLRSLDKDQRPIVIPFNPWDLDPAVSFAPAFFSQFTASLDEIVEPEERQELADKLSAYIKIFANTQQPEDVDEWVEMDSSLVASNDNDMPAVDTDTPMRPEAMREELADSLRALNRPIVVLVDDLDRLPLDDIFEMIRLFHHFVQFPRTSVLLAFDTTYIEHALESKGIANGDSYLDKLIQVRVPLPGANAEDMSNLIEEELKKFPEEVLVDQFPDVHERFADLYHGMIRYLIRTPRDVKKIFDRLRFSERATRGEVALPDLLALEALAANAPSVYEHIRQNPEAYTGVMYSDLDQAEASEQLVESFSDVRERLLADVPDEDRKYIKKIVEALFPLTSFNGIRASQNFYLSRGRVAAIKCLIIALTYGLPREASTVPLVKEFVSSAKNRKKIIRELLNTGEIERFLSELRSLVEDVDITNPDDFVSVLAILAGNRKLVTNESCGTVRIAASMVRQVWWVFESYFSRLDKTARFRYLAALVGNAASLTIATEALMYCLRQHGVFDEDAVVRPEAQWCTQQELQHLRGLWVHTVAKTFSSSSFCSLTGKREILKLLQRIDVDEARRQVESLIQLEEDLDCLVYAFGEIGEDEERGPYVLVKTDFLESLGGAEMIRGRVKQRLHSGPPIDPELAALYSSVQTGEKTFIREVAEAAEREEAESLVEPA